MAPSDPVVAFPWLRPNRDLVWIWGGVVAIGLAAVSLFGFDLPVSGGMSIALTVLGYCALFVGVLFHLHRLQFRDGGWVRRLLPAQIRRRVFDTDWSLQIDERALPRLEVHEQGFVIARPMRRRFVPWATITDVRLTDDELVFERQRRLDLRCHRATIDDADATLEAAERARDGESTVDGLQATREHS